MTVFKYEEELVVRDDSITSDVSLLQIETSEKWNNVCKQKLPASYEALPAPSEALPAPAKALLAPSQGPPYFATFLILSVGYEWRGLPSSPTTQLSYA